MPRRSRFPTCWLRSNGTRSRVSSGGTFRACRDAAPDLTAGLAFGPDSAITDACWSPLRDADGSSGGGDDAQDGSHPDSGGSSRFDALLLLLLGKRVAVMNFDYATVKSYSAAIFGTEQDIGK